jgi:hypothetical protein
MSGLEPNNRLATAAAAIVPIVAVECQPRE